MIATGNIIKGNTLSSGAGHRVPHLADRVSRGNEFKANSLIENACGLQGPTDGNTFKNNSFEGNVANACP